MTTKKTRKPRVIPLTLIRPATSKAVEQAWLKPGIPWRFTGYGPEHDKLHLGDYARKHGFIAGWWLGYTGYWPLTTPMEIEPSYPFHHPWVMVNWLQGGSWECQMKPPPDHLGRSCWWAVEFTDKKDSSLDIPDMLQQMPMSNAFGVQDGTAWDHLPAKLQAQATQYTPEIQALLRLPVSTLGAISARRKLASVVAWAWAAAEWTNNQEADGALEPSVLEVVLDFKLFAVLEKWKMPLVLPT